MGRVKSEKIENVAPDNTPQTLDREEAFETSPPKPSIAQRLPKHWPRKLLYLLAGLGVAGAIALALRPSPLRVETQSVERKDSLVTVDAEGKTRIEPGSRFVVSAPVAGRVARIALEAGDRVKQGEVVARINPLPLDSEVRAARAKLRELRAEREGVATLRPKTEALARARARIRATEAQVREARAKVQQIQAQLEQARRDRDRIQRLVAQGVLPRQDLENARLLETNRAKELEAQEREVERTTAEVTAATEELAHLQAEQSDPDYKLEVYDAQIAQVEAELAKLADDAQQTTIIAPTSGYVLEVLEKSERYVSEGTPLLGLGNTQNLELVIDVLSTDAVKIKPGTQIFIDRWGGEGTLEGKVRYIEPSAFTKVSALGVEEQRVNVIADLIDAPPALGDRYRVDARIVVWEGKNALVAPLSALFRCGDLVPGAQSDRAWCTFVVAEGKAHKRQIEIGQRNDLEAVVKKGLEVGEQVIVHPAEQIQDGSAVEPR